MIQKAMIKTFNYTDVKGKTTNRTVLVVQEPDNKLHAIDLSEIDDHNQALFHEQYQVLKDAFLTQVKALQKSFEVQHRYRTFINTNISDCVVDEL